MQRLQVYFGSYKCGELTENADLTLQFRYDHNWLEHDHVPVSTTMPIRLEPYEHPAVAPFVANLLPEGKSLRSRFERLLHVDPAHDFGLLSRLGREIAGALSFWPEGEQPSLQEAQYEPLNVDDFDRWREFAHQQPLLVRDGVVRMSLAGAQAKVALYFDESGLAHVPLNGAATTHIIKPRIVGSSPNTVFTELLSMRLARAVLGANEVPETDVWRNCYRIKRFDRPKIDGQIARRHQQDFCSAMGRMPELKYEGGSPKERLWKPCFELIDALGDQGYIPSPAVVRMKLLNQVILNVLLHNPDAHLKNYAMLYDGDTWNTLTISPLYDCLCTHGLRFGDSDSGWGQTSGFQAHTRELSLAIGNASNIDEVDTNAWELFAADCGITASLVRRRVRKLAEAMAEDLEPIIAEVIEQYPVAEQASVPFRAGVLAQISKVR